MQRLMLIVDDEKNAREGLAQVFQETFDVFTASQPEEAFRLMQTETFDVIITDLRMGQWNGMSVIDRALQLPNKPICIMMTAYGTIELAVEAMKHGAYDFISKPLQLDKLECMVKRAVAERSQPMATIERSPHGEAMLGEAQSFRCVLEKIRCVAPAKTTVLITGETGTGKELVAHQIHQCSARATQPFVPVHCAAFPENLLESELFGHERSAFTGASQRRIGLFEAAHHGTLFLDEIGEINLNIQVKLLRFLETKTIQRLGSIQQIPLDVRLVCATNRDLPAEIQAGRFREDLYYRLNVVEIHIPALRERSSDIALLLRHYLQVFAKENRMPVPKLSKDVQSALERYRWPGNIRELRNFAENVVVMRQSDVQISDLDAKFLAPAARIPTSHETRMSNAMLEAKPSEKDLILQAIEQAGGNKSKAAHLLSMSRSNFYRKLEKYGIHP